MKTLVHHTRAATGLLFLLHAATPALAQPEAASRYIHGSWVNVRATAAADSAVVEHLTANTPVVLRGENGKNCEIGWRRDGADAHGFVPCKLLGDKPLTPAEATSPPRAFWLAPSMAALFAAGDHFTETLLTPAQRAREIDGTDNRSAPPPRLVRYPVPEFEAMKALLAKGIVAPPGPAPAPCTALPAGTGAQDDADINWRDQELRCRVPGLALRLPPARPSLFKRHDQLAPGSADIEAIGARFRIVERGKVTGGPTWVHDYDTMRYTGAWDIGGYELKLDKPVVEHVIGRTGLVGAYGWTPQVRITPHAPYGGCAEGLVAQRRGKQALPGYPAVKDGLLWFQAPQALPFKTAAIKTRVERGPAPAKDAVDPMGHVSVHEIDLDRDGVPDFVEWDIWGTPQINGTDPVLAKRETYVNIGGAWYPFDVDYYGECT